MVAIKSKISRDLVRFLVDRFLKPEIISKSGGDYKFWSRETKILGKLLTKYPNEEFWIVLKLDFFLNSFAFFLSKEGSKHVEDKWRMFYLEKSQDKNLDKKVNLDILELNNKSSGQEVNKKLDLINWIDS